MVARAWSLSVTVVLTLLLALGAVATAHGFAETPYPGQPEFGDGCHTTNCHGVTFGAGPHGGFADSTKLCGMCHTLHAAPTGKSLLPRQTVTQTCFFCHDGTSASGSGVYGAIQGRGLTVAAGHRCEVTNVVPGGAADGGDATAIFSEGGNLGCGDCHTPHGSQKVAAFAWERARLSPTDINRGLTGSALLRQRPGDAATPVTEYGSDWCLACHKGRSSGGPVHNHPVDSKLVRADPYVYDRVVRMQTNTSTAEVVIGTMGRIAEGGNIRRRHNRGFVMPYPRVPQQAGHGPICQHCHEDARNVGSVGAVESATITTRDGTTATDNPRFQNFPHESTNRRLLVETDDDLCTNCHPPERSP